MKKLKLQALGLSANDVLTREQMKKIVGGDGGSGDGTCCGHTNDGGVPLWCCGLSKSAAQAKANEYQALFGNGNWCCDSCPPDHPIGC